MTETPDNLTAADVAELRRPFAKEAVKWLPIGAVNRGGYQQFMPHIDASLVFERLADVDPAFTFMTQPMTPLDGGDPTNLGAGSPWICKLTVKGTTRPGVGQLQAGKRADDKHHKEAFSDSVKRAALGFGIGAYLWALPTISIKETDGSGKKLFWTKTNKQGKTVCGGLNAPGTAALRAEYEKVVTHKLFVEHYGQPMLYGDLDISAGAPEGTVDVPDDEAPVAVEVTVEQVAIVQTILAHTGRKAAADEEIRERIAGKGYDKALPAALTALRQATGMTTAAAQSVHATAVEATTPEAVVEFGEGLDAMVAELKAAEQEETTDASD